MSKHTPGPWGFERSSRIIERRWFISSSCYSKPGIIDGRDSVADVRGPDEQTGQANARLIATAPELLEALKDALEHIGTVKVDRCLEVKEIRSRAAAALAKVKGEWI